MELYVDLHVQYIFCVYVCVAAIYIYSVIKMYAACISNITCDIDSHVAVHSHGNIFFIANRNTLQTVVFQCSSWMIGKTQQKMNVVACFVCL